MSNKLTDFAREHKTLTTVAVVAGVAAVGVAGYAIGKSSGRKEQAALNAYADNGLEHTQVQESYSCERTYGGEFGANAGGGAAIGSDTDRNQFL